MNTDVNNMDGKSLREFMEACLDYEMRGSLFYPLWPILVFVGFDFILGRWYGWKVNRKVKRMLDRPSEMESIVESRPEGGYFE
jgi:hypothetical protein